MPFAVISLAASRLSIEPFQSPEAFEQILRAPHQLAIPRLSLLIIITRHTPPANPIMVSSST
jgi:hypothetical protein